MTSEITKKITIVWADAFLNSRAQVRGDSRADRSSRQTAFPQLRSFKIVSLPQLHVSRLDPLASLHRRGLIRLGGQPRYPGRELGWRVDLIGRQQPETVLVEAGSPLGMRLEPGSMQTYGGRDQIRAGRKAADTEHP